MLFKISEDLLPQLEEELRINAPYGIIQKIFLLLIAHSLKIHYLYLPISFKKHIEQISWIRHYSHSYFSKYMNHSSVVDHVSFYIELSNHERWENNRLVLPYGRLPDSSFLQPTNLICEGVTDFDFYRLFCDTYMSKAGVGRIAGTSFNFDMGGGSTSYDVMEIRKKNSVLNFTVLDSDKWHPDAPLGSTSRRFGMGDTKKHFPGTWAILPVHELENLIRYDVLTRIEEAEIRESALEKQKILSEECPCYRFFDFKEGIKVSLGDTGYDFWKKYAKENEVVMTGIHDSVLEHSWKVVEKKNFRDRVALDTSVKASNEKFVVDLIAWGLASKFSL